MNNVTLEALNNAPAKQAWDAYAEASGGKTYDGKPLPDWEDLGEEKQAAWRAAANAVQKFNMQGCLVQGDKYIAVPLEFVEAVAHSNSYQLGNDQVGYAQDLVRYHGGNQ